MSETKIDSSFPNRQLSEMSSYRSFRRDRNNFGGGLILYVKDDIPCKRLDIHDNSTNSEVLFLEFYDKKRKWLLIGLYKPPSQNDKEFLDNLIKNLEFYESKYDNFILFGDFNMTIKNQNLQTLIELYDFLILINSLTCH